MIAICAGILLVVSCGGSDEGEPSPDPLSTVFRDGIYTRTKDGKQYEIIYGIGIGRYSLEIDGVEQRRGSYTHVTTPEGDKAIAYIDDGEFPAKCDLSEEPGVYFWERDGDRTPLDVYEEKCDQRKDDLEGEWIYTAPLPSFTPIQR
jgi:hypothetical protein